MSEEQQDDLTYKTCYLCENYQERYTIEPQNGYTNLGYCRLDANKKPLSREEKCAVHPCFSPSLKRIYLRDVEFQECTEQQDEVMRLFIRKYNP